MEPRGHASHHGVVTALSNASGKCLAVEVLSNIYKGCQFWNGKEGTEEHYSWSLKHQSVVKLFQCLGIEGNYTLRARKAKDTECIAKSTYKSLEYSKKRRKTLRAIKEGFQDKAEATEGDMCSAGGL
ncbi:hypothetical protein RRG08_036868 [Elysia crispata]|uniref:Uncharacterized protein n=1 Tax=Elysia crispata TaxID=231223 RepID=A0AAE0YAS0_9GAST|nr:hypothetical protein RRG08_036868 [Elysia crispata]